MEVVIPVQQLFETNLHYWVGLFDLPLQSNVTYNAQGGNICALRLDDL